MANILNDLLKNKKQLMILVGLVTLIVLIAYVHVLLRPQVATLIDTIGKVNKMRSELGRAQAGIAKIDQMKATIESYGKTIGRYEKVLPTEEGIPSLLESLSDMARSSNMKIVGIVPGTETKIQRGQTYHEIPIMVSVKSGYHELGRFLSALENSDRFMKIVDIHMSANPANQKRHDVELLVVTYVLLENK